MSQLVQLEGVDTAQTAHCALRSTPCSIEPTFCFFFRSDHNLAGLCGRCQQSRGGFAHRLDNDHDDADNDRGDDDVDNDSGDDDDDKDSNDDDVDDGVDDDNDSGGNDNDSDDNGDYTGRRSTFCTS